MNIDLLFTDQGEAGLISSEPLSNKVAGILFDMEKAMLTLEFSDMDYMDMNIPIDSEFNHLLDMNSRIHIGSLKKGAIDQAYQIPLLFSDDPYRNEIMTPEKVDNPLMAFQYFIKRCVTGQPVFREDLANEDTMGCILGDSSPSSLQFAPHLARAHSMEVRLSAAPALNAPGMGLGGSTSTNRGSTGYGGNNQTGQSDKGKKGD